MTVVELVFWLSSALVVYPYVGYPAALYASSRIRRSGAPTTGVVVETNLLTLPSVTMIISAYNEEAVIGRKLDNASNLDYPRDRFDVIVVSDGSTDRTVSMVEEHAHTDPRVQLLSLETQSGKSEGLNAALPRATGDIVVFSDANAIYERDALLRLVAPFADPEVGYSVGSALYRDDEAEAVNVSEGLYWKYELWIKQLESLFYSVVGGDGAIYAIRRGLFRALDRIDISDFVNPMQIIAAGYRGVFIPAARSYEGGTAEFSDEFRRKRRIVNRSWGAVRRHIGIFSWRRHTRFLFMLISHKVIRWWSCAFVLLALVSAGVLAVDRPEGIYPWLFVGIAGSIIVGLIGRMMDQLGRDMPKAVYLIYYFYLVGAASLLGIFDDFRGRTYAVWTHVR